MPVYREGPKGKANRAVGTRRQPTRRLEVTDAVQYVAMRWPAYARPIAVRLRLTLTMRRRNLLRPPAAGRQRTLTERLFSERARGSSLGAGGIALGLDWPQELRGEVRWL